MQNIWEAIKNYYITLGENYKVNPLIFLGIHVAATPLFIASVAWLIRWYRHNKALTLPIIVSFLIFNSANIYLVMFGKNIPWWIYAILLTTTLISGYFSYKKIRKKMKK
jgi:prepilin signal peptidase PulO-like enzyme (type II secretory pathway)